MGIVNQFDEDYVLAKTRAPEAAADRTLADADLRSTYGVTVVSIKRPGERFTYTTADTTVYAGDVLIVAGDSRSVQAFAALP
ncbi:TrkA C-terminal domain-containing protein [Actinoplanes sp. NPDC049802]|uniref:cation:proton antiporter regulatory subunit n=1 Tax=Actinoplanes sp. NPDC049802 TaxID=3154742 RepID=UPI0034071692